MSELKTLKDIYEDNASEDNMKRKIKAEAIKWVKHWRSIDQHCAKCDIWNEKRQEDMMYFFNLTEEETTGVVEDLK